MPPHSSMRRGATATPSNDTKNPFKMKRLSAFVRKNSSTGEQPSGATTMGPSSTASMSASCRSEGTVKMDKYGFLLEENKQRLGNHGHDDSPGSTLDAKRWETILGKSGSLTSSQLNKNQLKYYARRGLPDLLRQKAWTVLTGVDTLMEKNPDKYSKLVAKGEREFQRMTGLENAGDTSNMPRALDLLGTIQRDIHRTFPRHYLFHSGFDDGKDGTNDNEGKRSGQLSHEYNLDDEGSDDEYENDDGGASDDAAEMAEAAEKDLSSLIQSKRQLFNESIQKSFYGWDDASGAGLLESFRSRRCSIESEGSKKSLSRRESVKMGHGQDALRNVLRAYSFYDTDVGYCQGMNFIAAMFLTFLSEEESFWLLVVVMNKEPYKLRDLFGEEMSGTHEVLYIAEKLIDKFLPELSRHLEEQGIHVSMFITQWLVTLYVSEFPFDLVARVWDAFLVEGWKVVYRVMLALLEHSSKDILGMQFEQILHYYKEFPSMAKGKAIMTASLKIALKTKHIQKYATEWRRHAGSG